VSGSSEHNGLRHSRVAVIGHSDLGAGKRCCRLDGVGLRPTAQGSAGGVGIIVGHVEHHLGVIQVANGVGSGLSWSNAACARHHPSKNDHFAGIEFGKQVVGGSCAVVGGKIGCRLREGVQGGGEGKRPC